MKIRVMTKWKEKTAWEPWFAWFPVVTNEGELVWLETVYRKWDGSGYNPEYEYTFIERT